MSSVKAFLSINLGLRIRCCFFRTSSHIFCTELSYRQGLMVSEGEDEGEGMLYQAE